MKICFMCDLHLPFDTNALQYRVLDWAISEILTSSADCIICAGDITCDGSLNVYTEFISRMESLGITFLYVPGNSDLRSPDSSFHIKALASSCLTVLNDISVFAVNDCDGTVSDECFFAIDSAKNGDIVFMHHPIYSLSYDAREKMQSWRLRHPGVKLFYGHVHKPFIINNDVSLQALDPDKAIGTEPCITYYDTETESFSFSYFHSPVPSDLNKYFGISCYDIEKHIIFAIENDLKYIELRPNCLDFDFKSLEKLITKWRFRGGLGLSLHLPDVCYSDGIISLYRFDEYLLLAKKLGVDRFTVHVPKVALKQVREEETLLCSIAEYLASKFNSFGSDIVIGIENMHMTSSEKDDENRRFGYIPEECIEFISILRSKCKHRIGMNFDIGHARNNAPYSQKYQISTWFSMIGTHTVGFHMHQVVSDNGKFENHMPISEIYGSLISLSSFFFCWSDGTLVKSPLIFEMRPDDAYNITLKTFKPYFNM